MGAGLDLLFIVLQEYSNSQLSEVQIIFLSVENLLILGCGVRLHRTPHPKINEKFTGCYFLKALLRGVFKKWRC